MSYSLVRPQLRLIVTLVMGCFLIVMLVGLSPARLVSADEPAATKNEEADEKESDVIEIPDGSVEELFAFINEIKRNRGRDREAVMRSARGAVDTAAKIRLTEGVTLDEELKAIGEQIPALQFLASVDKDARAELKKLIEQLSKDERPEIQRVATMEQMKMEISSVRTASEQDQRALVGRVMDLIDESGIDGPGYSLASSLARSLESARSTELAASLYDELAQRMSDSKDERMQGLAKKTRGAARRVRLPGNFLELHGQTADGEALDWDSYRGKVVLVDYWASWCGPCRGEVPNMKRNLEKYGDHGFAIIGINMDRTRQAFETYVEKEEIPWTNIVSGKGEGNGWDHPMAVHYGIQGIPTAILVNREGKVVSLSARGTRLDALLADLIGDVEPKEEPKDEPETAASEK